MIMMFSETTAPPGWALCNGQNGSPDLRNRLVLGGSGSDVRAYGGSIISGSGSSKTHSVSTNSASAGGIAVTVAGATLSPRSDA
ncbi:tail fiber protein [Pseudoxanthomonas sp. UTMC 1351]|uniref:tail fiber protein n=1 Tax=Pseudoxanthomonas sp. UTMC 1351 TaxID=2695853 RepID=UPI0034CF1374